MKSLRKANEADAKDMLAIYSPYVLETPISFETVPPTLGEFQKRISEVSTSFPWIVCEMNETILGYAYANVFKARHAYRWSVESTVYVREENRGDGVGRMLYSELIDQLRRMGVVNVIGGISLPNQASVSLHEKLGYVQVAHFKNVGFKLGKWWDVGYWQLELQAPSMNPPELSGPVDHPSKRRY